MCLAIPGQVLEIQGEDPLSRLGKVSFSGIIKEVQLAFTPEARVDDYVLVHAGFAISVIDEGEAARVFGYLDELGEAVAENLPDPETEHRRARAIEPRATGETGPSPPPP